MTKLYVSEYTGLGSAFGGAVPILPAPIAEQVVDYTAGSTQSVAFQTATRFIVVSADSICSIHLGYPPNIALTTQYRLNANERVILRVTDPIAVQGGGFNTMNIAAITNT